MKNLQQLVQWTRFGLVSAFFIVLIVELTLGVLAISGEYSILSIHKSLNISIWKNILGIFLIIVEIIISEMMYKKKLEYVGLFETLEEKLKYFRKAFSFKMLFGALTGIVAMLAYSLTENLIWFLPWIMALYTLSKSFPFKWTLVHAMQIENEEDRELF
ncbi:hypothetical protein [Labilibaculum euxinus]|uniref:Uncharacterized protein n=1 Tax=Labilibaculum euxinus TaxID=2686357 RepID=A0A7M4D7I0_9BACT|nr:hypothetical protein [Labilibaculum euxinus]MUP38609.1 hypothetical protein [Labilibaculum euxinus]MVB07814.1 hypothetical protein [Labilibaculum euxinus]